MPGKLSKACVIQDRPANRWPHVIELPQNRSRTGLVEASEVL